ncbi:MAG: conserved hypothetical rane protein [Bacteroidetes bacterium]|nr:conserved hypothetical rane protein [Bacteroidota bacterium]
MKFARWVFIIAGIYGVIVITPLYFSEADIARDFPPAITHPEHFYGFLGVTLAWQILFLMIAIDPVRYRMMMLASFIEKGAYVAAVIVLYFQQRVPVMILSFSTIDLILGVLFIVAFWKTGKQEQEGISMKESRE